jgi:hypothetical protein
MEHGRHTSSVASIHNSSLLPDAVVSPCTEACRTGHHHATKQAIASLPSVPSTCRIGEVCNADALPRQKLLGHPTVLLLAVTVAAKLDACSTVATPLTASITVAPAVAHPAAAAAAAAVPPFCCVVSAVLT